MELIFIYNAKSGLFNGAIDYAHKLFSPSTYDCKLCTVTYGALGMKKKWKNFLGDLKYNIRFLHKDELVNTEFKDITFNFPCILLNNNRNLTLIFSHEDFKKTNSLEELMEKLKNNLKTLD